MTTAEQLAQLREVAERAWEHVNLSRHSSELVDIGPLIDFTDEFNPAVVLALIDELERKDKQIAEMTDERTASMNEMSRIIQAETNAKRAANKRIAELEARHTKLRESMAAIHNTIRLDGVGTSLSGLLSASKIAWEESAPDSGINLTVEG